MADDQTTLPLTRAERHEALLREIVEAIRHSADCWSESGAWQSKDREELIARIDRSLAPDRSCDTCGRAVGPDDRYCRNCGVGLD